jgi:hypothetical protein
MKRFIYLRARISCGVHVLKSNHEIKPDYESTIFFAEVLLQDGYDLEIDEGMSSKMKRYLTLDVTALSNKATTSLLERIVEQASDFGMCKAVQVAAFKNSSRKYLAVSGESHILYQTAARDVMLEMISPLWEGLPVKTVGYVEPDKSQR